MDRVAQLPDRTWHPPPTSHIFCSNTSVKDNGHDDAINVHCQTTKHENIDCELPIKKQPTIRILHMLRCYNITDARREEKGSSLKEHKKEMHIRGRNVRMIESRSLAGLVYREKHITRLDRPPRLHPFNPTHHAPAPPLAHDVQLSTLRPFPHPLTRNAPPATTARPTTSGSKQPDVLMRATSSWGPQ